ncbi:hypothetical protein B0H10DRAFT_1853846 [Mycena sp. CBHHK59/15]|nr:hypothetical protein B0H10DRAFT_1853846 [Mycena sp. CBHHK59/15]
MILRCARSTLTCATIASSEAISHLTFSESPLCQTCHRREDVSHFLFFCSRYHHHRVLLRSALGRKANSLGYLLTTDKGIRHVLRYIHATNRLPIYRDITPPEPSS